MASVDWTYEDGDKGWVVELEVTATVVPYVGATREEPSDGGYLEDEVFKVTGFKLEVGKHVHEIPLTSILAEALAMEVKKVYDADGGFQDEVFRKFEE